MSLDEENITNRSAADKTMLLAPVIRSSAKSLHAFSFSIYRNFCLIADKDHPKNPGVAVYSIPIDLPNLQEKKSEIARAITESMMTTDWNSKVITTPMFADDMTKKLKLIKRYDIPLTPQYGSNCSWSSCAKAVLFSALYCRLYDTAKALPRLANYPPAELEKAAHEFASEYARSILKCWANEDKYRAVQDYIAQLSVAEKQGEGPGPIVLACIYLKYSQRQGKERIIQLIDEARVLQPEHLEQARKMLLDNAVKKIQNEHPILFTLFEKDFKVIAEKFAELYLLGGKKVVEEVYNSVVTFSFAPFKNAIIKLDVAIDQLKAAREERPKFTDYTG